MGLMMLAPVTINATQTLVQIIFVLVSMKVKIALTPLARNFRFATLIFIATLPICVHTLSTRVTLVNLLPPVVDLALLVNGALDLNVLMSELLDLVIIAPLLLSPTQWDISLLIPICVQAVWPPIKLLGNVSLARPGLKLLAPTTPTAPSLT